MSRLVHPKTAKQLAAYVQNPFHALLLVGDAGSGKATAVDNLIQDITSIEKAHYPYVYEIDGLEAGIDEVRALSRELSHAFHSQNAYSHRFVVIKSLEEMGRESHAALLKMIEEPPKNTLIVLMVRSRHALPATIISRSVTIDILPVTLDAARAFSIEAGVNVENIDALWHRHHGRSAHVLQAFSSKQQDSRISDYAKKFTQSNLTDRLCMINELTALQRPEQKQIIELILAILQFKLQRAAVDQKERLINANQDVLNAARQIDQAVNAKLLWLNLSYKV